VMSTFYTVRGMCALGITFPEILRMSSIPAGLLTLFRNKLPCVTVGDVLPRMFQRECISICVSTAGVQIGSAYW
jgi:hypothetical protein